MEVIFTLDEIGEAAKKMLAITEGHKVLAIHGEMGAGKTTFIQALCEAMGVQDHVSSPTFSIINQYINMEGEIIYHMDLYRIKDEAEATGSGVEDCLFSGNSCLVEWPEKALGIFPDETMHINIAAINANTRKLSFQHSTKISSKLINN
ncbi:MAG: tRNA (adenosine(37)-N6)-threonylcarbamoyltransferase complex ATPase subunit type 1 TsaE [Ferruginibacter sp.]|nr:tRNA (adenosine(37)-N6)-threonylcarbamoyltransferase complex ATPase subunit type 1 TsaE [Ferruginibacter sp.]